MGAPANVKQFVSELPDGRLQISASYEFEKAGDELPMHEHPFWHNCQVIRGSVLIYDDAGKSVTLQAGQLAGLSANRRHAIQAAEDNTLTVHTNEPGKP